MMNKFYITTSLPYINSRPHVGFALEIVQADVVARWQRMQGADVFFLTGTDEHGSKIAKIASEEGTTPQALAERNSALFSELKNLLNISNDDFIRTSDQSRHWPGATKLWQEIDKSGDIYKDTYAGLYCVGCEAFITEKDLDNGNCPIHQAPPEAIKEDNYFFRLSKYAPKIASAIEEGQLKIIPEGRAKEILNVIKGGLTDISFSRPASKLPWGIPVPDDTQQTMYVWCDALSNYITGIGYGRDADKFNQWWPADVHVIGKDILRFHAAIWPAMLLSAGLELPRSIFVHGFISSNGQKMSKSLGNVVDPAEIVDKYGTDALRYYLLREIPAVDDGDFSWQRFTQVYNSELADNLGNLLSRALQMTHKFTDGKVPDPSPEGDLAASKYVRNYKGHLQDFDFAKSLLTVNSLIGDLNALVDHRKPWELAKSQDPADKSRLDSTIYMLLEGLRLAGILLYPFLPGTANTIHNQLGLGPISKGPIDWQRSATWGQLSSGHAVGDSEILFPKTN